MKKRIISLLLSVVMVLSLVCVAAPSVSAASAMKTSENAIALIKSFEGFSPELYPDNGNLTIGYGTSIPAADADEYQDGITEAEADKLMREYLAGFERSVNAFIDTHNLNLKQHQFDALISFTYNFGGSWMNNTAHTFTKAVISGATGNDFIFAITRWCKASGVILTSLVNRRLSEANMYLNGVYSKVVPANYRYVILYPNMEGAIADVSIHGYDSTKSDTITAIAEKDGYEFLGWYTEDDSGVAVTKLNAKTTVSKLYGHWQKTGGEYDANGVLKGVPAKYDCYAATEATRKVYDAPGGEVIDTVDGTYKMTVVAEHLDSAGNKWGKLSGTGWINVSAGIDFSPVVEKPESVIDPITVTVTSSGVNNRTGPGTNYAKQGTFTKGQQLILTAVEKGGNYTWGKSDIGWICLDYTDYMAVTTENNEDATKVTATGVIIKTDALNVRSGPGVTNAKVGTYYRNDQVKITLRQKVGNTTWGLTEKGWVSLYYVKVTEVEEGTVPDISLPGEGTGDTTTPDTSTSTGSGTGNGSTTVVATGKISYCNSLRIRAGAGTSYPQVGSYKSGTYVNIYETVKVNSQTWGRTSKGWISLRYVMLDAPTTGEGVTGRVYNCTAVNVRAGAGTHFAKVAKLDKGTKVEILEYTKVGNATWGRTYQGWIHLHYVKLDAPLSNLDKVEETPDAGTGDSTGTGTGDSTGTGTGDSTGTGTGDSTGTGTGDSTGTGTGDSTGTGTGDSTGTGTGDSTGTGTGDSTGTGTGTTTPENITFNGTIYGTDSVRIRADAGVDYAEVGSYKKDDRVTILEIKMAGRTTWGRTDKGWVSLYYVKPDGTTNTDGVVVKTAKSEVKCYELPSTASKVLSKFYINNLLIVVDEVIEIDGVSWTLCTEGWIIASKIR